MTQHRATPSAFVRGYLWASARFAKDKPISGPNWVAKTVAFGKKVVVIGASLLVLCFFLPDDSRRWMFVGMGVMTVVMGLWHQRNAQAIFDAANGKPAR